MTLIRYRAIMPYVCNSAIPIPRMFGTGIGPVPDRCGVRHIHTGPRKWMKLFYTGILQRQPRFSIIAIAAILVTTALLTSVASAVPRHTSGSADNHAHRVLRRVLGSPIFHQWKLRMKIKTPPGPFDALIARFHKQISHFFHWLFRRIFHRHSPHHIKEKAHSHDGSYSFGIMLLLLGKILIVVVVLLIIYALINLWLGRRPVAAKPETNAKIRNIHRALEQGDALALASGEWMDRANDFAVAGDFRLMYRALYLALLAGLHEKGKIRFRRCATNYTFVRSFHGTDSQRHIFEELTNRFDHVWYGWKVYPTAATDELKGHIATLLSTEAGHA